MTFPRNSLRAFLSHAKKSLATSIQQAAKVTIVTGNESADLDSFTSSVLYAYFSSLHPPRDAFTPIYVPLLNISSSDISLRPEFTKLFQHANISPSHLVTLDDLPLASDLEDKLPPSITRWILVDHNSLQGNLGAIYASRVHGVIDHHEEENVVPKDTAPEPRIVEKSGSCSSLVIRTFKSKWDALASSTLSSGAAHAQSSDSTVDDSVVAQGWDAQVAKLALGSILDDTSNLKSESKTMPVDREMVEYLEAKINMSIKDARSWDRDSFYEEITAARKDIEGISLDGILRKDYKQWTEDGMKLGMSSVVKPLEFMTHKAAMESSNAEIIGDSFITAVQEFIDARDLSIFAITTNSTGQDGQRQRQIFLQAKGPAIEAAKRFGVDAADELGLVNLSLDGIPEEAPATQHAGCFRKVWQQKSVEKSRKQIAPLLRQAMHA